MEGFNVSKCGSSRREFIKSAGLGAAVSAVSSAHGEECGSPARATGPPVLLLNEGWPAVRSRLTVHEGKDVRFDNGSVMSLLSHEDSP